MTRYPAPPAEAFARWPAAWAVLGDSRAFGRRPVARERFGRRLVVYRTAAGSLVAMDARCWHLGADLVAGSVAGDCIACPFHGWQFDADGRCRHVPAQPSPPADARQATFDTAERGGLAFVYPAGRAGFPLPFFAGVAPGELVPARPFDFVIRCPWWMVGTNGFDLQHFLGAHDRRLIGTPTVTSPHAAARRIVARFAVCGRAWRDRLTRRFSGDEVTMDVTVWAGTLAFVVASFRRAADPTAAPPRSVSYGMVEVRPLPADTSGERTLARVRISVRRRRAIAAVDRVDVRVRANFIRAFLRPDAALLDGARYDPARLIAADDALADYLRWLAPVSHGLFQEG